MKTPTPNGAGAFPDYESPARLAKALYKGTDCGAWLNYGDNDKPWSEVHRLEIGSIIEGAGR